jgi:hypothetical protein
MSKKLLVEVNVFAKLLSFFYDAKSKGNGDALQQVVAKTKKPEVQKAYDAWKRDNEQLLLATKRLLQKADLDTSEVDSLLKQYHNY